MNLNSALSLSFTRYVHMHLSSELLGVDTAVMCNAKCSRPVFDFSLTAAKINISNVPFASEWCVNLYYAELIDWLTDI